MKKCSVLFMVMVVAMFFVGGCASDSVQVGQESQEVVMKIASRRAGVALATYYPEKAKKVFVVCHAIMIEDSPDLVMIATNSLSEVLTSGVADPILEADIRDILSLIKLESGLKPTEDQIRIIKIVAESLLTGIAMSEESKLMRNF